MTTAEMTFPNKVTQRANPISLRSAALLAGIGLLIMVIVLIGELSLCRWLLVKGVDEQQWKNRTRAAVVTL